LRFARRARADLIDIWIFDFERWGEEQADRYAAMLRHVAYGLVDFPDLGPVYAGRNRRFRSIKAGAHRIVYRRRNDIIEVVRVLHARTDPKRHLG